MWTEGLSHVSYLIGILCSISFLRVLLEIYTSQLKEIVKFYFFRLFWMILCAFNFGWWMIPLSLQNNRFLFWKINIAIKTLIFFIIWLLYSLQALYLVMLLLIWWRIYWTKSLLYTFIRFLFLLFLALYFFVPYCIYQNIFGYST